MGNGHKMTGTLTKDNGIERIRDVADNALEKGRETWNDLRDQGKDALAGAQKSAKAAWNDSQKLLQKHPGKAVGLALLVGAVIGGALIALRSKE